MRVSADLFLDFLPVVGRSCSGRVHDYVGSADTPRWRAYLFYAAGGRLCFRSGYRVVFLTYGRVVRAKDRGNVYEVDAVLDVPTVDLGSRGTVHFFPEKVFVKDPFSSSFWDYLAGLSGRKVP